MWAETDKGTLEKRTVVLGTHDENMMQYKIENGLERQDYVAYPQEFLKEGMKTTHEIENSMQGEVIPEGEMLPEGEAVPEGEALPEGEVAPEGECSGRSCTGRRNVIGRRNYTGEGRCSAEKSA